MAMSQDDKDDAIFLIKVFSLTAFIVGLVILISYLGYINGEFDGACEYAGGSVTDNLCIDGDTVLFTYDNWNE